MSVLVACPKCGVMLDVPETLIGQQVRCATCSTIFAAQAQGGQAPSSDATRHEPPGERVDHEDRNERRWGDHGEGYDGDDPSDSRYRRSMRRDLEPHRGSTVLTMGIISLAMSVCTIVCALAPLIGIGVGITALAMGHADLRKIRGGSMDPDGQSQTRTGIVLAYIGLGLSVLALLACGAYLVFVLALAGNNGM